MLSGFGEVPSQTQRESSEGSSSLPRRKSESKSYMSEEELQQTRDVERQREIARGGHRERERLSMMS